MFTLQNNECILSSIDLDSEKSFATLNSNFFPYYLQHEHHTISSMTDKASMLTSYNYDVCIGFKKDRI